MYTGKRNEKWIIRIPDIRLDEWQRPSVCQQISGQLVSSRLIASFIQARSTSSNGFSFDYARNILMFVGTKESLPCFNLYFLMGGVPQLNVHIKDLGGFLK